MQQYAVRQISFKNALDKQTEQLAVPVSTDRADFPTSPLSKSASLQAGTMMPHTDEIEVLNAHSSAGLSELLLGDVIRDVPRLCVLHRAAPRVCVSVCRMMLLCTVGTCNLFRRQGCSTPDWLRGVKWGGALRRFSKWAP